MAFGRFLAAAAALVVAAGGSFWYLTIPERYDPLDLPAHEPDLANGELLFWAGGCTSCHAAPGAKGEARLLLVGGVALETPFGRFNVPNITPDPDSGIGGWTMAEFVTAMRYGTSPAGRHYYPAFPYTSYARMTVTDVMDLKAWLDTLPAEPSIVPDHELAFPYNFRRGLGLWKLLNLDPAPVVDVGADPELERGRYLTEGPGHCGECHTPRDVTGGLELKHWLAGAPAPDGKGRIPNITSGPDGLADWSTGDIAYALESGFKPDYDTLGSTMAEVQANLAKLPASDREAIAAYLKATPPLLEGS
ncbi:MAG: cytochrome c [Geminicoccaceae bacterium]|jgi:mono/diheme cytochrome c family protein|nr:cytochrome c [Geminicoccaceae bacterium]HRY24431.1 cytochrome c [Geminicoccaceae bacterium]